MKIIGIILSAAFLTLGVRLWDLQVYRGVEFRGKSDRNRLRIQSLEASRGVIYGRLGDNRRVVLADSRPARDLMFVPADCNIDPKIVVQRLEQILQIDSVALMAEIEKARKANQPHGLISIRLDAPAGVSARIDEYSYALPGVITVVRPMRRYVYGSTAGQVLGYLGEVSAAELKQFGESYRMGDLIGRAGLERLHENRLRGTEGKMLVTRYAAGVPQLRTDPYGNPYVDDLVDDYGHSLHVEREIEEPVSGRPVYITLDIGLQARAEALLEAEEGAIVVLNADTGQVLVLASSPGYDPSVFVTRHGNRERHEFLHGKPKRMLDRAFQELYAPGSIFKVLLAAAALEEGVIDENTSYYCAGRFRITPTDRAWHCWNRSGHGQINVVDALAFSCDVFFYQVGLELGVDEINTWSKRLGLGRKTGIDLPGEVSGLIPSRRWKEDLLRPSHRGQPWEYRWYPGDTVNLSIGQGATTSTPLQNAVLMAAIINGGRRVQPYLNENSELTISDRLLSERTVDIVRRGLRKCVEKGPPAPTGTGNKAYIEGMTVLGKTGSAQNVSLDRLEPYENDEDIPKHLRDHAWFVAGVLDREPHIAVCVLVEHGHHGSSAAAPLARDIIERFYSAPPSPELNVARQESAES